MVSSVSQGMEFPTKRGPKLKLTHFNKISVQEHTFNNAAKSKNVAWNLLICNHFSPKMKNV